MYCRQPGSQLRSLENGPTADPEAAARPVTYGANLSPFLQSRQRVRALKGAPRIMAQHSAFRKSLVTGVASFCLAPRPPLALRSQVLTFKRLLSVSAVKSFPRSVHSPLTFARHIYRSSE